MEDIHKIDSQKAFDIIYGMICDIIEIVIIDDSPIIRGLKSNCLKKLCLEAADEKTLRENNINLRAELFEELCEYYKTIISPKYLELFKLSIKSFKSLINELKFDEISDRNAISLIVYFYCLIAYFKYALTKNVKPIKNLQKGIFKHIIGVIKRDPLLDEEAIIGVINDFLNEKWKIKKKSMNKIIYSILCSAKNKDFKPNYDQYMEKKNDKNQIKNLINDNNDNEIKSNKIEAKNNKKMEDSAASKETLNNRNKEKEESKINSGLNIEKLEDKNKPETIESIEKNITNKQSVKNIENRDNNINMSSISTENDIKIETNDDEIVFNLITSTQADPKLKQVLMMLYNLYKNVKNKRNEQGKKIENLELEVNNLKDENKEIINNQIALWNSFQFISNGRDIWKSIVFYFYQYLGLKDNGSNTYTKLSSILKALKDKELKEKTINNNVDVNKLSQFFYLEFFLNKLLNKIVHRNIKYSSPESNRKAKLIPTYSFEEAFKNIKLFINTTIKDNEIQVLIKDTIDDYIKDSVIENILKYDETNLFLKKNNEYHALLTESDINNLEQFFKDIKVGNKTFCELCETKKWTKGIGDIILEKPVFHYKGNRLDEADE